MSEYITDRSVSVVLPPYNEEESIVECVSKALFCLKKYTPKFEIIIVDDGSKDQTYTLVQKIQSESPKQIKVIRHNSNQGYGASLNDGFLAACGDYVFYTDSDNQFDISELKYFIPHMDSYDIVAGFRIYRYDSVLRCLLSWIYNRIVSLLFNIRLRDIDCAFKLFKREIFNHLKIVSKDFFVNAEIIGKAQRMGYKIYQKGVRHYPRLHGHTTVRPSDIPKTLYRIVSLYTEVLRTKKLSEESVEN